MRFPLLIDPQLQGIKWIKKKEANNNLIVIRMSQKDALRKLEGAMENGHSLLIVVTNVRKLRKAHGARCRGKCYHISSFYSRTVL